MPSRSDLPGSISRERFCNALRKLGFVISTKGGKGNHYKATWKSEKSITISCRKGKMDKDMIYYVVKAIRKETGITWDQIKSEL